MITQTDNMELINSILCHPLIWPAIAPVGVNAFDAPYVPELIYFLVNGSDGVVIYHPFMDGMKIHPNILPDKRGKRAFEAIEETIQAMFKAGHRTIYAEIDPELRNIIWLAQRLGFAKLATGERELFVRRLCHS